MNVAVRRCWFVCLVAATLAAGCAEISVRRTAAHDLSGDLRASVLAGYDVSSRTKQTLRRYDLAALYCRKPAEAADMLHAEAVRDPETDLLIALAEMAYVRGRKADNPTDAVAAYRLAAGYAYHYLFAASPAEVYDPRFRLACELYNAGLAHCLRDLKHAGSTVSPQQFSTNSATADRFSLSVAYQGFTWKAEQFGPLLFCDDYRVEGLSNHYRFYGLGVPLIGSLVESHRASVEDHYPESLSFPVTAFLRFEGSLADLPSQRSGRLELINPLAIGGVNVGGRAVPLEADLTTPEAYSLAHSGLQGAEYTGFLKPDLLNDKTGLHLLHPYQKGKIPVVMVHGLLSTPLTWAPVYNDLMADPAIRDRFQFWAYFYPTGEPYLTAAADLRQELSRVRHDLDPKNEDPAFEQMVFLGHSMGGLISHLMTVDGGDDFWAQMSDRPLDQLRLRDETREDLRRVFYFVKQPGVRRVVFIATPHHGSKLSPSLLGRLGSRLVGVPHKVLAAAKDAIEENPDLPMAMHGVVIPTSVDMLAPDAPALQLLAARPRPDAVHYHSVVGILPSSYGPWERLLNPLGVPEDGDGVVPYRSAHLDGVDSELKVPADHTHVHHHPLAIREIRRILLEHAKELETIIPVKHEEVGR